jgi:hypothetical protein
MVEENQKYEETCAALRQENEKLLESFAGWLTDKGLSERDVAMHRKNIDFYINQFLLFEDAVPAAGGVDEISYFLGFWFIMNADWASEAKIQENAVSLAEFYAYMRKKGHIDKDELKTLQETIGKEMPGWLDKMRRFEDPSVDSKDIWDI